MFRFVKLILNVLDKAFTKTSIQLNLRSVKRVFDQSKTCGKDELVQSNIYTIVVNRPKRCRRKIWI